MRVSSGTGRYGPALDVDIVAAPLGAWAKTDRYRVLVFAHGATGSAQKSWETWQRSLFQELGRDFVVVAADLGGDLYANAAHLQRISEVVAYARSSWNASTKPVFLYGESMGAAAVLAWARANPTDVAAVGAGIPLLNIKQARDDNVLGLAAAVNAAYPGGTYDDTRDGPTASPIKFAATLPAALPIRLWTSSNDAVVPPSTAAAFLAARPQTVVTSMGARGHDYLSCQVALEQVAAWFRLQASS